MNTKHSIIIIEDEHMKKVEYGGRDYFYVDLAPGTKFDRSLLFMPFHGEHSGNIGYFKLKLWCERQRIRLISWGHMNQLPLLSGFSDAVWVQQHDPYLQLYSGGTDCGFDWFYATQVSHQPYFYNPYMKSAEYCSLMDGRAVPGHDFLNHACREISDDEVISRFAFIKTAIRQSTWNLFESLDLSANVICAEVKRVFDWKPAIHTREFLEKCSLHFPVIGLDHSFQQQLLGQVRDHYMGIQILCSLLKNWQFVCVAGSASLFSMLPAKTLMLFDDYVDNSKSVRRCVRGMSKARFGAMGEFSPFLPDRASSLYPQLVASIKEWNQAISAMSDAPTPHVQRCPEVN